MGPYGALNPRTIWIIVILVMGIGALGHIAVRLVGARYGLPMGGFASGFISGTATIAAMGARAAHSPEVLWPASAGAVLSSVGTIVQLALVLTATNINVLGAVAIPLALGGAVAVFYGVAFLTLCLAQKFGRCGRARPSVQSSGCRDLRRHARGGVARLKSHERMVRRIRCRRHSSVSRVSQCRSGGDFRGHIGPHGEDRGKRCGASHFDRAFDEHAHQSCLNDKRWQLWICVACLAGASLGDPGRIDRVVAARAALSHQDASRSPANLSWLVIETPCAHL